MLASEPAMSRIPRSLPRICVALGYASAAELAKNATREHRDGADFLEFRLDFLADPTSGVEVIRKMRRMHPELHILATCRHRHASGKFTGSMAKQIEVLKSAAEAGASLLDLEIESAEKWETDVASLRLSAPLVISYHNFERTPSLEAILRRLREFPADVYKIATTARRPSDNLRVVQFIRDHGEQPSVVLAMAEPGTPSRVLGPPAGSLFTYAAPAGNAGTAPGQIQAQTMRALFRPEKLNKSSRVYGIIASPVAHSKSPYIHNRAFQARRLDAVFLPFLVTEGQLSDWMKVAVALPVAGFSVTLPHKRRILRYLDVIDPLARRIGAVNTVSRKAGKWRGSNTDAIGVIKPLGKRVKLAKASVLIAGYGGAARAAAVALREAGAQVTITGRKAGQAQALARTVNGEAIPIEKAAEQRFAILINATPVGMTPNTEACLFEKLPAELVMDMVYNPRETVLLKRAKAQGCGTVPGTEMLLEQAVAQFEIWTGEAAPRGVMWDALESSL